MCRLIAGLKGTAFGDGGFLIYVVMRLILGGIAALIAGFGFGLALQSEGRDEISLPAAEQRAESPRLSVVETIQPRRFDERFSFDEPLLFDRPRESFDQRFAAAAVLPAGARATAAEAEEATGSVLRIARLPSPEAGTAAMALPAGGRSAPKLASLASPASAGSGKKTRLAALEPKGLSLDPDNRTAIYDITARTVYMPDGRRLEAHSGFGDRMDDPRYVNVKREGPTPPNVYDLSLRESLFHGVRALRMTPVGEGKMYGRDGILVHSYLLGPNGQSNGCVSVKDYPAFLNAFLRGEVTRVVVVERLANPPTTQVASASFLKSLRELFSGRERTDASPPERATGYAAAN